MRRRKKTKEKDKLKHKHCLDRNLKKMEDGLDAFLP
jgi:hypothetical protein